MDTSVAKHKKGRSTSIFLASCIVGCPLLVFDIVLIIIIALYAEPGSASQLTSLHAIYVDINATTITTITSWSSTIAPLLGSFMVVLSSYPAGLRMLEAVRQGAAASLPTPYQLAMLLEIRTGTKYRAFKRMFGYWTKHRNSRATVTAPLNALYHVLVLGIMMSLFVFASDTALHLLTTSEVVSRFSPSSGTNMSFALRPNCLSNNNSFHAQFDVYLDTPGQMPCTLNPAATQIFLITDTPLNGLQVLNNVSTIAVAKRFTQDGRIYQYLSPIDTPDNLRQDYSAFSYAMSSTCSPRMALCTQGEADLGASTPFNCSENGFAGNVQTTNWQIQYYTEPDMPVDDTDLFGFQNPFYFIGAVSLPAEWSVPNDTVQIGAQVHGDHYLILNCTTTVFDVQYRVQNQTLTQFNVTPSNMSVTNALQSSIGFTHGADFSLVQGFSSAGFSNTTQEMLDEWATSYDHAAISMSVTALQARPATASHYRDQVLVAMVPVAPLVCLLLANLLYTLVGLVLTIRAFLAGRDPETQEIVERMTVLGVVADYFEPRTARNKVENPEDMFQELHNGVTLRVGITPAQEGGYGYGLWNDAVR